MAKPIMDFENEAKQQRPSLLSDLLTFLGHNKKWWLLPILICLALLTFLVLLAGSGAAPFIYTLF